MHSRRWPVTAAAAVVLGAIAATAHGLYEVAAGCRVPPGIAWLYPVITDGLALVAYAATTRLGGIGRRYAWSVVVLGAGLSGLGQAVYLAGLETPPVELRFGVGAWPAVAAAIAAHLLYLLGRPTDVAGTDAPLTPPVSATPSAGNVHPPPPDVTEPAEVVNPGRVVGGNVRGVRDTARPGKAKPDAQRAKESRDRKKRHDGGDHSTCLPKNCPHVAQPANGSAVRDALLV